MNHIHEVQVASDALGVPFVGYRSYFESLNNIGNDSDRKRFWRAYGGISESDG